MTEMGKVDLPYVQRFKDRHGKVRHYFRKPGRKRMTLRGEPGSVEFAESYAAAKNADKPAICSPTEGPRSIGAAIGEYYASADFKKKLSATSQKGHRGVLETFRRKYGALPVASVTPIRLNQIFHQMADTPAQAANLRKRLNAVFRLVVSLGWLPENPIQKASPVSHKSEGFAPWSDDDIAAYERRWPAGTRERLALALLLYTGVRRSDAVLLGRQHVKDGRLSLVQTKTKVAVAVPIHPTLQAEIDASPLGMTFLMTQYGKPFSAAGFTNWFVERAEKAGVLGKGPHGLRKACGSRMAEAGCSGKEIAAVLGHTSLAMVETYTRSADQKRLADSAMEKVRGNEAGTKVSNLPADNSQTHSKARK